MSIQSELELTVTREKMERLRRRCEQIRRDSDGAVIDRLTLQSLVRMINQFEEEIAMYQARVPHTQ